uniref:Transporter-associated domain-containing protein n=2 Tax=Lotus japonicus TaxID=34305 RepID=I3SZ67_LOTJA|nr:unknown [Lotus japonicus]
MRAEGIFDVDANTSIDQLSDDLNIKMPEGIQYETVSGFVCEAFGYIPRTGESIKVVLEREDEDDNEESDADRQDQKEKNQIFKLEILAGNARKVSAVRFERVNNGDEMSETKEVTRLVPKIMKRRKWSSDEDSEDDAEYDGEAALAKRLHDDAISSEFVVDQESSHTKS